ncbi:hypothetical protein NQZ68_007267 [Dissostichus eleginoides]|nr:hypothetical protein NQZ68_007267 [Dissostichus eleginoides]
MTCLEIENAAAQQHYDLQLEEGSGKLLYHNGGKEKRGKVQTHNCHANRFLSAMSNNHNRGMFPSCGGVTWGQALNQND